MSSRAHGSISQSLGDDLAAAAVVEYNPARDTAGITADVAAKVVKEIASRMLDDA